MSNFSSIHFHTKRLYIGLHIFNIVDTPFSYGRGSITSGIFQIKRKYSACNLNCRYCVFTLWGSINVSPHWHSLRIKLTWEEILRTWYIDIRLQQNQNSIHNGVISKLASGLQYHCHHDKWSVFPIKGTLMFW